MTTLFNGTTNGGANRVFVDNKDGELKISGQAASGNPPLDADLIATVWGGTLNAAGALKLGADSNDLNDATISISASGGGAFIFAQLASAGSFFGNFKPGQKGGREQSAEAIESKFQDLDRALDGAKLRQDAEGNWEISMSGGGLSGRVSTNGDFDSEEDAQAFLDSLRAEVGQPDAYSVIVEDDDLDGDFVFEFSGNYQDINKNKIEAALADSAVVSDGEIGSDAEGAAANLALFLETMATSGDEFVLKSLEEVDTGLGNVGQVENGGAGPASAEAIGDKFTGGVANAVDRAQIRTESDGDFEIFFTGNGVAGAATTNGDFTEAEAAEFLAELQIGVGGFLDDALL